MCAEKENLITILFTILASFALPIIANAHSRPELAANRIDPKMLQNANAVVRAHELEINIEEKDKVLTKEHVIVTIMNEAGDTYGRISEYYSWSEKILNIEGAVYDRDGNLLRKISKSDPATRPAVINVAFYDDWRTMRYQFTTKQYPYTIEYTVEKKAGFTHQLPRFEPQPGNDCSVEQASLTVFVPINNELRFKNVNIAGPATEKTEAQTKYSWQVQQIKAERDEPLSFTTSGYHAAVLLACRDFAYSGYTGSQDSWLNFGKFAYELNKGRDELPPLVKETVHTLTDKLKTDREKIDVLYKYLQENNRYVAIEYGIGGWQTLDAAFVAKYQYGDCKALTNFMMSLLKEAGITSYHALIEAGEEGALFFPDIPMSQFNHVILCIPLRADTVWLECTADDLPANYLGNFTQDRTALLITPEGGKLFHTPKYESDANSMTRYAIISNLSEEATKIAFNSVMTGELANETFHATTNISATDLDHFLHSKFRLPGYSVEQHEYIRKDSADQFIMKEEIAISAQNIVSSAGRFMFVNSDPAPLDLRSYPQIKDRKTDFFINDAFSITDSFEIDIPRNIKVSELPKNAEMVHPFGQYSRTFTVSGNKIFINRRFVQTRGAFQPELFNLYVKWIDAVKKDNEQKLVFEPEL